MKNLIGLKFYIVFVIFALSASSLHAETVNIAVAANFTETAKHGSMLTI